MRRLTRLTATALLAGGIATSAAATAQAATPGQWDQVAQCESGGDWQIDTGNGFYGGLQFTADTWQGYGGGRYAPTADGATRDQQIEIGEQVLAGQGPGAWPVCGGPLG